MHSRHFPMCEHSRTKHIARTIWRWGNTLRHRRASFDISAIDAARSTVNSAKEKKTHTRETEIRTRNENAGANARAQRRPPARTTATSLANAQTKLERPL